MFNLSGLIDHLNADISMLFLTPLCLLIGLTASLVGIGGGVLLVPFLNLVLGMDIKRSVGTSLFVIFFIALTATCSYWRRRLVSWRMGLLMEGGSIPGAVASSLASPWLPSIYIKVCFVALLAYIAIKMWRGDKAKAVNRSTLNSDPTGALKLVGMGFLAGSLSGLLGIGGGVVKVPILVMTVGMPMHSAVATSEFMIMFTVLSGALSHGEVGNVNYGLGLLIVPWVVVGSFLGTKLAVRLKRAVLRKFFSVVMILIAFKMALSLLG